MTGSEDIITTLITQDDDGFATLLSAVETAGLTSVLQGEGPFTVFAPNDDAHANIPDDELEALFADPDGALSDVLLYHVIPDTYTIEELAELGEIETLQGEMLSVTQDGDTYMVNGDTMVIKSLDATNGIVHVLDMVLMPPSMAEMDDSEVAASQEMTETDEMTDSEEMDDSDDMTDSEEMDDSMEMTDSEEMDDSDEMTDSEEMDDSVEMTDSEEMDDSDEMTETEDMGDSEPMSNLVEVALANDGFSTLVTALSEAGLVEALQGEGPFTVFAPNDDAFAKIPDDELDALLADPQGDLTDILLYHVVSGEIMSTDIEDGQTVETLQGSPITVSLEDGQVLINNAVVVQRDLRASNGVIHVVDTVLMPPGMVDEEMDDEEMDDEEMDDDAGDSDEDMADDDMADEDMADDDMADDDMADDDMADEDMADEDMADEDMD